MANSNRYGLILAGGRGTRFWPRSRRARAKQVLNFFGERSLIQETVDRLAPVLPPENIWILTNDHLRAEIVRQLPEVPKKQILAEPEPRNTAPAIGLAAHMLNEIDPDSVMGVFPADHVITKPSRYVRLLRPAFKAAEQGKIVVLGIQPRWAETGYGYIEFPQGRAERAAAFRSTCRQLPREAGPADRAQISEGRPLLLECRDVLLEDLGSARRAAAAPAEDGDPAGRPFRRSAAAGSPPRWPRLSRCARTSPSITRFSKKRRAWSGLPAEDIGWNDVGSWNAVYELNSPTSRTPTSRAGNCSRSTPREITSMPRAKSSRCSA